MVLIGAGHTLENPGIVYETRNEFEVCRQLAIQIQESLSGNQIGASIVPFDLSIKDRIKWFKDNHYNNKKNIYIELHLSSNACAHVVTGKNNEELKKTLLTYFDTEAEIDVEELPEEKNKNFEILGKLSAKTFIIEAGNIVDYAIPSDFSLTADAISHAVKEYLTPYKETHITNHEHTMPTHHQPQHEVSVPQDPSKRREDIRLLYKAVLGREADTNGIAYYMVHTEITLDQIMREMVESTDHEEIVRKAQEFDKLKEEVEGMTSKLHIAEKEVEEKQAMIKNYEAIAMEKSHSSPHTQLHPEPIPYNPQAYNAHEPYNVQNLPQIVPEKKKGKLSKFIRSVMGQE